MDSLTIKKIKIALLLRDWTLKDLAQELNVTPSYLSMIFNGKRKGEWVWKAVSKELSLSESEVI